MHVVTFYSFKGGVGRSMALANVAYALAKSGRRVLAVDFDLEAPGLCSYTPFKQAVDRPGMVEFVHRYLETDEAPAVEDYLSECEFSGAKLWLMPAGRHRHPDYSRMLNDIDWKDLYDHREGFLLMEDLKEQWRQFGELGFDYVLIDSRTGHTDVGGICTRQLPDAVVVMFVPTPQNIDGLEPVVAAIAAEPITVRERPATLHFCPSNVPDLDDDERILADLLEQAQDKLGYSAPAAVIQHYRSLDLLLQPVVTQSNPGGRLARQFEELRRSLVAENLADKEGALLSMDAAKKLFHAARDANDKSAIEVVTAKVAQIRSLWPLDGEVAWRRAAFANERVRPEEEIEALDTAIAAGVGAPRARLHRAYALSALGNHAAALQDVRLTLAGEPATIFEIGPALHLATSLDPSAYRSMVRLGIVNERIGLDGKIALLMTLMDSRAGLEEAVDLAKALVQVSRVEDRQPISKVLVLAYIGLGRFGEALRIIGVDRRTALAEGDMDVAFNFAIADWGASGIPPVDLMTRVLMLRASGKPATDPNILQCLAVANSVLDQHSAALADLEASEAKVSPTERPFSCWRYLKIDGNDFLSDLREMQTMAREGRTLQPPLLRGRPHPVEEVPDGTSPVRDR